MPIAAAIDHTLLKPEVRRPAVHRLVAEAIEHGFAAVCVNGRFVDDVARMVRGTAVQVCTVVDFPLGAAAVDAKAHEAVTAVRHGAGEIDFVAHLPPLLQRDVAAAGAEWACVVKAARAVNPDVCVKVIIESALLMQDVSADEGEARIAAACAAAKGSGCDFVKTATGFHPAGGATADAVRWMKGHGGGLRVKASGGIRTRTDAERMLAAGADRLGTSSGVAILRGDS